MGLQRGVGRFGRVVASIGCTIFVKVNGVVVTRAHIGEIGHPVVVAVDEPVATIWYAVTIRIHRIIMSLTTVGVVGNAQAELIKVGKAGRNRWKGVRPQTRGVAMNPVDHPHGGGEGKSSGGRHPVSPWGKPEGRTRNKKKKSQDLIVRRRRTRGARR